MILTLVSKFGIGTKIFLSNLLKAAMSNSHGILVVANTDTFSGMVRILSIYLRNYVLILLSVSDSLPVLVLPKESISSMSIIDGASSLASSKSMFKA